MDEHSRSGTPPAVISPAPASPSPKSPAAPLPLPTVSAVAAVSLDGRLSPSASQPSDWTGAADKKLLRRILNGSDWLVVGRVTYELHRRVLDSRRCLVLSGSVQGISHLGDRRITVNPQTADMMGYLRQSGALSVTVIGGCRTYSFFLERDLIDILYLTVEPIAFGCGPTLFDLKSAICRRFRLENCQQDHRDGSVFLRYGRLPER